MSPEIQECLLGVKLALVENHCSVSLEVLHDIYFIPDLTRSHVNREQYKDVRTLKFVTPFPPKTPTCCFSSSYC